VHHFDRYFLGNSQLTCDFPCLFVSKVYLLAGQAKTCKFSSPIEKAFYLGVFVGCVFVGSLVGWLISYLVQ